MWEADFALFSCNQTLIIRGGFRIKKAKLNRDFGFFPIPRKSHLCIAITKLVPQYLFSFYFLFFYSRIFLRIAWWDLNLDFLWVEISTAKSQFTSTVNRSICWHVLNSMRCGNHPSICCVDSYVDTLNIPSQYALYGPMNRTVYK